MLLIMGWNSPYLGIYGGSKFIYNEYCAVNQDTLYYGEFDVSTKDGDYTINICRI